MNTGVWGVSRWTLDGIGITNMTKFDVVYITFLVAVLVVFAAFNFIGCRRK